ncbi:Hsp20/alpha crystallin family protein [uncultured Massilia sp.]|uniref:Hsp20/alpha crystallin family protein n=1 Tax=uncultured Massilia sp. TaxID=169973 RepID=UPI0025F0AFE0|nr:Hsp20/alpha crystallin family protein [uncultured Massilia sp.]
MASNVTMFDPMREVMRLDPFRSVEDLMREFAVMPALRGLDPERRIRVDVHETDQAYLVKADMPGLKKDDIQISVDGNVVSISATVQGEREDTQGGRIYTERYSGAQYRSFALPHDVDDGKTEAKYKDGVLHLTLPKKAGAARKQIRIQ